MLAVYVLAAIGLFFILRWLAGNARDLVEIAAWIFWIIPNALYCQWVVRRRGWTNPVLPGGDENCIDPDHWVHPDFPGKEYTLYAAYHTKPKN